MDLLRWIGGGGGDSVTRAQHDLRWAWVTVALSALVAAGYVVIAFNWYFQSRFAGRAESRSAADSRAALGRLRGLVLCCAVCGYVFFAADLGWAAWRLYDLVLLVVVFHTWTFVLRMRGLSVVDERLAQVDELERTAKKYREIAELLPHAVWTADAAGRVDFSNRSWTDYAGADGRSWLDSVHPEERRPVLEWWAAAVAGREAVTREVRLGGEHSTGYRTFVVKAAPIVRGDAVRWLGACADVEDQKRLAAEKELQARQRTFFLNALSHDLRAPLNTMVLNAHLLKMSARDAAQVEIAGVIIENALAAGDLVTNLLEFAKAGADGHEGHSATGVVSLAATLRQVLRRFQPLAEKKGLYLRLGGAVDGVEVVTDRLKLERVVSNLVDNAIKYTSRGGVTIGLGRQGDDGISVYVEDTGIGVPEKDVPYLFDEFYQVNNHERDRSKGFGMGLAICRCLARQLGGDVRLAGTGAGGSRFELSLAGAGDDAGVRIDRRGRPGGETRDPADPREPGLRAG